MRSVSVADRSAGAGHDCKVCAATCRLHGVVHIKDRLRVVAAGISGITKVTDNFFEGNTIICGLAVCGDAKGGTDR